MRRFVLYPRTVTELDKCLATWEERYKDSERFGEYMASFCVEPWKELKREKDTGKAYRMCYTEIYK